MILELLLFERLDLLVERISFYKLDLDKFNGSNDFILLKVVMKTFFVQQSCAAALESDAKLPKEKMAYMKAHNVIMLCMIDEVLHDIVD